MLAVRLAQSRKIAGLSQGQLAAAMGDRYDQTMISHVETGRSGLLGDGLSEAARVLGVSIDYLLGLTDDPRSVNLLVRAAETSSDCAPDVVRIPLVAALTGAVMDNYDDTVLYTLPFPRRWLDEQDLDPEKCRLMKVGSKFMEPTLPEGSTILVDRGRREFQGNCIYVMELRWPDLEGPGTALVARRVIWDQREEDWFYVNDAGGWGPSPFLEPPTVIGQVRWVQRTL